METIANGKLYIKKHSLTEWIMCFILFFTFVSPTLVSILGLPNAITFLADVCLVILFIKLVFHKQLSIFQPLVPILVITLVSVVYLILNYLLNYQSVFYFVWGLRNHYRFYIAFFAFVLLLKWEDATRWLKLLDYVFVINLLMVLVEFVFGYRQDYLGGIFGINKGSNGGQLILLAVVVSKSLLLYMSKKEPLLKTLMICGGALLIATLAEIKMFFLLFVLIMLLATMMTPSTMRKWAVIGVCCVGVLGFSTLLSLLYDEFAGFLSAESLINALINPNYSSKDDIGRLVAIPMISKLFLTTFGAQMFGMGIGNTDFSGVAIFNTPFYDRYQDLNYMFYSYASLYLEVGMIGLLLYFGFFVALFFVALWLLKRHKADAFACQMGMIAAVLSVIFTVYNSGMRFESAVIIYFILALPFISSMEKAEELAE